MSERRKDCQTVALPNAKGKKKGVRQEEEQEKSPHLTIIDMGRYWDLHVTKLYLVSRKCFILHPLYKCTEKSNDCHWRRSICMTFRFRVLFFSLWVLSGFVFCCLCHINPYLLNGFLQSCFFSFFAVIYCYIILPICQKSIKYSSLGWLDPSVLFKYFLCKTNCTLRYC